MLRCLIIIGFVVFGFTPSLGSCAEAKKPAKTVSVASPAAPRVADDDHWLEAPYGEGRDEIGFQAGGDERETLGPTWFEVEESGAILLADPIHRKLFRLTRTDSATPLITVDRPLGPREGLPPARERNNPPVMVVKTGAESGTVVFGAGEGAESVGIEVGGPLASLKLVGVTSRGEAVIVVETFRELGKLAVDRELLQVNPDGKILTRIPLEGEAAAPPAREFFLAPDDTLYRMIPGTESVVFTRWVLR